MEAEYKEVILKELKKYNQGYTVSELARKLKISRHSVSLVFAYLEGANKITIRKAGMAKIYYWKEK